MEILLKVHATISGNTDGDMTDIDVEELIRNIKMYSRMEYHFFSYKNNFSDIMGYIWEEKPMSP